MNSYPFIYSFRIHLIRLTVNQKAKHVLDFVPNAKAAGEVVYKLFLISDSYIGCDQDFEIVLKVSDAHQDEDKGSKRKHGNAE